MTHDDRRTASVAIRAARLADDMLKHVHVLTPDPVEQAGSLLTAAFVLIERHAGRDMAAAYLKGLIEPQLAEWCGQTLHETVQ